MYEFEILLENGSTDNISGYSYEDALSGLDVNLKRL